MVTFEYSSIQFSLQHLSNEKKTLTNVIVHYEGIRDKRLFDLKLLLDYLIGIARARYLARLHVCGNNIIE